MYCFILKDCAPPKKLIERGKFSVDGKSVSIRFIKGIGQSEAIKSVLDYLIELNYIRPADDKSYNLVLDNGNKVFAKNSPYALVLVDSDFDIDFPYDLLLSLSLFQGFPARLFALIKTENGKPTFSFYPEHIFRYNDKTLFLPDTDENYETIISNAKKNRYIIELYYEASAEQKVGMKIAKYFTLLELLSQYFPGKYKLDKIKELFTKFQFLQPFVEKHKMNLTQVSYELSQYYKKKSDFSSIEIMYMYRNIVVHDGIYFPPEFTYFLDSDNIQGTNKSTPLDELEWGIHMIIKTILRDGINIKTMHLHDGKF